MSQIVYLKTACERCSGHIEYPSELTGQSIECPHCHQPTPLPPIPRAAAVRPQPIDYGLTRDDLQLYDNLRWRTVWRCQLKDGKVIDCIGTRPDDKYKCGRRWFGAFISHRGIASGAPAVAFWLLLFGGLIVASKGGLILGVLLLGAGLTCLFCGIVPAMVIKDLRKRASPCLGSVLAGASRLRR
jgi:hypothetical protein